jgi:chromosome segregation ATPase
MGGAWVVYLRGAKGGTHMGLFGLSDEERELLKEMRGLKEAIADLRVRKDVLKREIDLSNEVVNLKRQISDLEVKKSSLEEKHAREDRELRHMIGLEKKRQEFEVESSKKDAVITVRQENLDADKKRFEDQMKFQSSRFTEEVVYLKSLMGEILDRLPTVTVDKRVK